MTNHTITTVSTSQSPDAKPVVISKKLTTNYIELINVPNFSVPELVFGGSFVLAPGVAEIISPLMITNKTATTAYVDIDVFRFYDYSTVDENGAPASVMDNFLIASQIPIPAYDTLPFPMNGQFFYNGDVLQARADQNDAIDVTLSFTLGQAEEFLED